MCLAGPRLRGLQVRGHLLGGLVGGGAGLVGGGGPPFGVGLGGLGYGCAFLGRGPGGFDLGLGCGRVAEGGHRPGQPLGCRGERAGELAHLPEQFGAGDARHGDGLVGLGLGGDHPALGVGQAAAFPPCGHGVVRRVGAVLGRAARLGGRRLGRVPATGELARRGAGLLGHDALRGAGRL